MDQQELLHGIALKQVPNVGDALAKTLISYCGSAQSVFKTSKNTLLKIPGLGTKSALSIRNFKGFDRVNKEIEWNKEQGIKSIFYLDKEYPYRLKDCSDSPLFIFSKGITDLNNERILSIVGTRMATPYGKEFCASLAEELAGSNTLIVSGLAYGIDAHAHKGALKNQLPTAAVLGHGLRYIAPPRHKDLAKEITDQYGCLITEHFSDEAPVPENFPKRNRIVAGMCDALLIVESGIKGGAMITAELAWGYNRELFALPGRITDTYSHGCNKLISNSRAMCVQSPSQLVQYLGWKQQEHENKSTTKTINLDKLSDAEKTIVKNLREGEKRIDDLHYNTGIALGNLSMVLLDLEFKGIVRSMPGKTYKLSS